MKTADQPVIVEQLFDNSINEVWKANRAKPNDSMVF